MKVFEWDDLRIFLAVLRARSINGAAKLLGSSRSTVSRRLQAMEDQIAIKLFVRNPEGFVLTEVGEAMVARAERIESEILSMEREVFGRDAGLAGPIRISMFPQVAQSLVMPYIAQFAALYPDIEIELDASFEKADLTRRSADIAIRFQKKLTHTFQATDCRILPARFMLLKIISTIIILPAPIPMRSGWVGPTKRTLRYGTTIPPSVIAKFSMWF